MTDTRPNRLSTSESLALDVVRVVASVAVAFGHLTQPYFSSGWKDRSDMARNCVAVFFVLSGFVIRYVTRLRPISLSHYLGDRASRIYSIAIPALLMTWCTDSIARRVNPVFYAAWASSATHPPLRILINLLFGGELWHHVVAPLSNNPYWSINYEVSYYILYGLAFYLAGMKRAFWLVLFCLVVGPRILALAPLWLLGCLAYDVYERWNVTGKAARYINSILTAFALVAGLGILPSVRHATLALAGRVDIGDQRLGLQQYAFGIVWTAIFMRLLLFARNVPISRDSLWTSGVRFIAEGTFPIYLLHFPLYVLIAACIPYNHASAPAKLTILAVVVLLGILAGHPGNLLKDRMRKLSLESAGRKPQAQHLAPPGATS